MEPALDTSGVEDLPEFDPDSFGMAALTGE